MWPRCLALFCCLFAYCGPLWAFVSLGLLALGLGGHEGFLYNGPLGLWCCWLLALDLCLFWPGFRLIEKATLHSMRVSLSLKYASVALSLG